MLLTLYSEYFHAKKGRPQPTVEKTMNLSVIAVLELVPPGMQLMSAGLSRPQAEAAEAGALGSVSHPLPFLCHSCTPSVARPTFDRLYGMTTSQLALRLDQQPKHLSSQSLSWTG